MEEFAGKTAVVTGAGSGMGKAFAITVAAARSVAAFDPTSPLSCPELKHHSGLMSF